MQSTTYALERTGGRSQVLPDGTNTYLYGLGRLAQHSTGGTGYFLPDGLGSVRTVADANGKLVSSLSCTAFCRVRAAGITTTDYRYTGQLSEAELVLNTT